MEISQFFIKGDMKGAIAYMREHEEFRDVLPAYTAIFEEREYRTFEVPERLNEILRWYQVYFRDTFYLGLPEAEAADKLRAGLGALLGMPGVEEALLTERLRALFEAEGYLRCSGRPRAITARTSGGRRFPLSTRSNCRTERRSIPSICSRASCSGAGWTI